MKQRVGTATWVVEAADDRSVDRANLFIMDRVPSPLSKLDNASVAVRIEADGVQPRTVVFGNPSPEMERLMNEEFAEDDPEGTLYART